MTRPRGPRMSRDTALRAFSSFKKIEVLLKRSLFDDLKRDLPHVAARAPRWYFPYEVAREISDFWESLSPEDTEEAFKNFNPLPEVLVETETTLVMYVHNTSDIYEETLEACKMQDGGVDVDGRVLSQDDPDACLNRVYIDTEALAEKRTDKLVETAYGVSTHLYLARLLFRDRYVERKVKAGVGRSGRQSRGGRVEEIKIRWNAPTPKYVRPEVPPTPVADRVPRGPVCEHGVREFLRKCKSGKIAYVKAHTRGTRGQPRKGVTRMTPST